MAEEIIHVVMLPWSAFGHFMPFFKLSIALAKAGAEATMDIPFDKIQYLEEAYDQLQHPVRKLVSNWLPNWIICDYNPHWIVEIAHEFRVKLIYYSVVSAATLVFLGPPSNTMKSRFSLESLTSPPKGVTFLSSVKFNLTVEMGDVSVIGCL
ncbi:unnamed protein product [Vicia faba]|uniref:Uncharacterized protein n=1 Tax=Vicia faba TaxID=3906 RepID=A0AAV1AEN8_VICFA|nr:unnamed protein product [Vicia faba]